MTEVAVAAPESPADAEEKLRAILVGAGGFGQVWWGLNRSSHDIRVVAVVDPDSLSRDDAGSELGLGWASRFADLGEALGAVDAALILDCSPPQWHAAHALLAFAHGLHLFTAKPMAASWIEAVRMATTADEAGLVLGVNEQLRYGWLPLVVAHEIQSGSIGAIESIEATFREPSSWEGWRTEMAQPLLVDAAVQHFDLVRAMTGLGVMDACCRTWSHAGSCFRGAGSAAALFTLEGGVPFVYTGSWDASPYAEDATGWWGNWRIQGSDGEIRAEGNRGLWVNGRGASAVVEPLDVHRLSVIVLDHFIRAVRDGKPMPTDGWSDLRTLAMVELCQRSARSGSVVRVEDLDPPLAAASARHRPSLAPAPPGSDGG